MSFRSTFTVSFACLAFGILPSCQTAKKRSVELNESPLIGALAHGEEVSEETIEKLKEIANDPASNLEIEGDAGTGGLASHGADLQFPGEKVFDPVTAWKRPGLNPRSISPGDIFSENVGPVLNKSFSLADALSEEQRKAMFEVFASAGTMRVPMTISSTEMADLRNQAAAAGNEVYLPSRSVALDFRALTYSSDNAKLEQLFDVLASGSPPEELAAMPFPAGAEEQLSGIKKRLKSGEKLFVITGVTESTQLTATYPGAPVGRRDAEPIQNAVQQMFPHLDQLEAVKEDRAIILSGSPRVLWEFEARELKLDGDKLTIDSKALAQL
jgi:hypothetical protein